MSREAFLPLFFGDFLASTAEWTGEEAALYLLLLGHQWSLGTLPDDPERVRRLVRYDRETFAFAWPIVSTKFARVEGRLLNQRLEEHRKKAKRITEVRAEAGRKGATARAKQMLDVKKQMPADEPAIAKVLGTYPYHTKPYQSDPEKNPQEPPSPQGGPGGPLAKRIGTPCPQPFHLTAAMRTWCADQCPHVDPVKATAEFVDYWRAIPGQRGRKLDWIATWRNGMRLAESRAARTNGSGKPRREGQSEYVERLNREADEAGEPKL